MAVMLIVCLIFSCQIVDQYLKENMSIYCLIYAFIRAFLILDISSILGMLGRHLRNQVECN
jgi:hypothetical protein